MNPLRQIRCLVLGQIGVGVLGTGFVMALGPPENAASFGVGALISLFSVWLLAWSVGRLLLQKTVAWTVALIISKYAILLSSIYYLTRAAWFRPVACGLGVASFTISALVGAVIDRKKESSRGTRSL